jgi:spore coat polysaccharide biosynthesis predicted glycosyltransferase SpsG/CMP-N-acetylneuraminic acid synthetase
VKERCIIIPAVKKNAVIPDQLVKKLAGVTLMERAIQTARCVASDEDIVVVTDSEEISLICERAGVCFRYNNALHFTSLDIVAELRETLCELVPLYAHLLILRASCPLLTGPDVEDAWRKYRGAEADGLVTVKSVRQRIWNVRSGALGSLLGSENSGEERFLVESRALIILRSALLLNSVSGKFIPYFLNERSIEIQSYQDWWICEHLLMRRHIVFVVAGYPAIGMGHVYRALMLAHEITNHKITFVCTRQSELAVKSIAEKDYRSVRQGQDTLTDTVLRLRPDLVVNDILNTDMLYMTRLRAAGVCCVNFEDEGPGAGMADLVVNALYEGAQSTQRLCCGPEYFCLRDEFVSAEQNQLRDAVKVVLITFGGTDSRNFSRRVLDVVEPVCRGMGIAVRLVAGPGYAHKKAMEDHLRALKNDLVEFTWATNAMSRMMEGADLAVCSAGRTLYELAHMRVPAMVVAHHEREVSHSFARPRNGFAFLGIMDRIDDVKLRNVFLAMLRQSRRARFFERQARLDFRNNKAKVVGMMLDLLKEREVVACRTA